MHNWDWLIDWLMCFFQPNVHCITLTDWLIDWLIADVFFPTKRPLYSRFTRTAASTSSRRPNKTAASAAVGSLSLPIPTPVTINAHAISPPAPKWPNSTRFSTPPTTTTTTNSPEWAAACTRGCRSSLVPRPPHLPPARPPPTPRPPSPSRRSPSRPSPTSSRRAGVRRSPSWWAPSKWWAEAEGASVGWARRPWVTARGWCRTRAAPWPGSMPWWMVAAAAAGWTGIFSPHPDMGSSPWVWVDSTEWAVWVWVWAWAWAGWGDCWVIGGCLICSPGLCRRWRVMWTRRKWGISRRGARENRPRRRRSSRDSGDWIRRWISRRRRRQRSRTTRGIRPWWGRCIRWAGVWRSRRCWVCCSSSRCSPRWSDQFYCVCVFSSSKLTFFSLLFFLSSHFHSM